MSLLIFNNLQAQVVDPTKPDKSPESSPEEEVLVDKKELENKRQQLIQKLKNLSQSNTNVYIDQLELLRNEVDSYIENKRKECLGELASVVVDDEGNKELVKRKLSKDEKKLCLHQLKIFNSFYIGQIFDSRKEFLTRVHENQLKHMETTKDQLLDDLEKRYKKIDQEFSRRRRRSIRKKR